MVQIRTVHDKLGLAGVVGRDQKVFAAQIRVVRAPTGVLLTNVHFAT